MGPKTASGNYATGRTSVKQVTNKVQIIKRAGPGRPQSRQKRALFAPKHKPIELGFFRRLFSVLCSRHGNHDGEIPTGHFQRVMSRLLQIIGENRCFNAKDYDVDSSGTVGWWEFVACWKDNEFYRGLSTQERIFLSIDDATSCLVAKIVSVVVMSVIVVSSACFMLATLPGLKGIPEDCEMCTLITPEGCNMDITSYTNAFTTPVPSNTANGALASSAASSTIATGTASGSIGNMGTLTIETKCKPYLAPGIDPNDCMRCEPQQRHIFWIMEAVCVFIFTLEYLARLSTCHSVRAELFSNDILLDMVLGDIPTVFQSRGTRLVNFIFSPPNLVDFLAILPFYLEILPRQGTTVLRVIRLTRLFRLLKAVKYFEVLQIMGRVLRRSASALYVLLFYLFLCVCFSGSLIYYAESGKWHPELGEYLRIDTSGVSQSTPFQSIPGSFWWCTVTLATVGYGDMFPVTAFGQIVGCATILCGLLVLAMPISVLSSNFGEVWREFQEEKRLSSRSDEIEREAVESALAITNPAQQLRKILVEIWDEDVIGDRDFLGEVELEFDDIGTGTPSEEPEVVDAELSANPIKGTKVKNVTGSVRLELKWEPFTRSSSSTSVITMPTGIAAGMNNLPGVAGGKGPSPRGLGSGAGGMATGMGAGGGSYLAESSHNSAIPCANSDGAGKMYQWRDRNMDEGSACEGSARSQASNNNTTDEGVCSVGSRGAPLAKTLSESTGDEPAGQFVTYAGQRFHCGQLTIKVVSAENLQCADFSFLKRAGSSDPYAVVTVWPFIPTMTGVLNVKSLRTKTVYTSIEPVWNEELRYEYNWTICKADITGDKPEKPLDRNIVTGNVNLKNYQSINDKLLKSQAEDGKGSDLSTIRGDLDETRRQMRELTDAFSQNFRTLNDNFEKLLLSINLAESPNARAMMFQNQQMPSGMKVMNDQNSILNQLAMSPDVNYGGSNVVNDPFYKSPSGLPGEIQTPSIQPRP